MAFLTQSEIAPYLPSGVDTTYVNLILGMLETYLAGYGFLFTLTTDTALKIYPEFSYQYEFRYLYFTDPVTVTIKSEENLSYSKTLTIRKDYNLKKHHKITTANYLLSLKDEVVQYPYYIELNTQKGFSDTVPNDLKFACIEFVKQALNIQKSIQGVYDAGGQEVRSTSIDGISTTFVGANTSPTQDKIQELLQGNSGIMQIIKNYLPRQ
jgi:hypothetical protein